MGAILEKFWSRPGRRKATGKMSRKGILREDLLDCRYVLIDARPETRC